MFPFNPPARPTTPLPSYTPPPPTAPILTSLYSNLLRPTLLPPPPTFTQPLLDSFVQHHDPLTEGTTLFTAPGRLREVGVEVDKISRDWGRRGTGNGEEGGKDMDLGDTELKEMVKVVRAARLRTRLQNQGGGNGENAERVRDRARERMEAFEREMAREEEEALKAFKEGLRRAVGAGNG